MMFIRKSSLFNNLNIPRISAGFGIAIGILVMIGWVANIRTLQTLLPQLASMKFNTALCFFLLGFALLAIDKGWGQKSGVWIILPLLVILIGVLSLAAYQLQATLFLDELFSKDPYTAPDAYPGRMSSGTATNFVLIAVALSLHRKFPRWAESLAVLANFIGLAAVLGYLFDFGGLYQVTFFNTMAIHTAVLFMLLSVGTIFVIPRGLIHFLFVQKDPSGTAIRYLMPAALFIPAFCGWLVWRGHVLDVYGIVFATILLTLVTIIIMSGLSLIYALTAHHWYVRHQAIQEQLTNNRIALIQVEQEHAILEMKERFLAMLSHDIRNPAAVILTSSDILVTYEERLDAEKRVRHLSRIRNQANTILNLVEDMMLINSTQTNTFPFNPAKDDLVAFCRESFQKFAEMESDKPHHFSAKLPDAPVEMAFDQRLINRLLENLLRNAVKYSPDGGEITLGISRNAEHVVLMVSDTGIGIPQTQQNRLFQLFSRASNVGTIPGYGLGLAIVKQIVDVHHGQIEVQSVEGKGTTFRIILPMSLNDKLQKSSVSMVEG
ncbi:MAG: HAMP domain-containing histidine kinase [Anaerolineae bacterium]|nr:HAMP domain-containing histidine kinase [Anaerolineae bacterium]